MRLGTLGFGGPVALVGAMRRDLVEERGWFTADEYSLGLSLAQIMPGPLAAQLAMALGYFRAGIRGALLSGIAFVTPSFLMVLALGALYVAYGGLWWMRAVFYGVGACVIAIIAVSASQLARKSNGRDPWLWGLSALVGAITILAQTELAILVLAAGILVLFMRAPPDTLRRLGSYAKRKSAALIPLLAIPERFWGPPTWIARGTLLATIFFFFLKAGAFVFGSGLAIVPFLHQGVVEQYHWLTEAQFLDAVAVAMITPGPVVITVGFIGYLVAGVPGAVVASIAIFLPVFLLTVLPLPWFSRHRSNAQLKAFVSGATAAAVGALGGAVFVLGTRTINDAFTVAILGASLGALVWWRRIPEPVLVVLAGAAGVAATLLHGTLM
ncbi:MAG: chromate efflux transporter [Thermoplasmatota archaeon]